MTTHRDVVGSHGAAGPHLEQLSQLFELILAAGVRFLGVEHGDDVHFRTKLARHEHTELEGATCGIREIIRDDQTWNQGQRSFSVFVLVVKASADHENRARCMPNDAFGDTSEDCAADPAAAMRAKNHEIDAFVFGELDQRASW